MASNVRTCINIKCIYHYSAYIPLNNYLVFNDVDGLYTYTFEAERKVSTIKGLRGYFFDFYWT